MNSHADNLKGVGAVILAAGKGTRLKCVDLPKVMKEIGGRPMVSYIVDTLLSMGLSREQIVLVVGFCRDQVRNWFGDSVTYAIQEEQRGTAHAAYFGMKALPAHVKQVLVLGGDDSAFYRVQTLLDFLQKHQASGAVLSLLTANIDNPAGLGRIVRHADGAVEIIEKEYLTEEQKGIKEISTGTFCFDRAWFERIFPTMPQLRKLGEFGLPTALAMARAGQLTYHIYLLPDSAEWFGVNTPEELEEADKRKTL